MPRKQFFADVAQVQEAQNIDFIHDLEHGEDDGQITFLFAHNDLEKPVKLNALVTDLGEYPKSHEYCIFTADEAPSILAQALNSSLPSTNGKDIASLLKVISKTLAKSLATQQNGSFSADSQPLSGNEDGFDDDEEEDDDDDFDLDQDRLTAAHRAQTARAAQSTMSISETFRQRIREDLLAAKTAGFKVGHLGPLLDGLGAFVTVSCRMRKLGISAEAMQAWKVEPSDYLIIILQYQSGYRHLDQLRTYDSGEVSKSVGIRVGASKRYKPTVSEALAAFTTINSNEMQREKHTKSAEDLEKEGFHEVFISNPLNSLLNERLVPLLRRRELGMSWAGAEAFYIDYQGTKFSSCDTTDDKYFKPDEIREAYPNIVQADHYSGPKVKQYSFPLLAMQFLLRHFVRCTEFCLVCHRHLSQDFQAIKPYVCDKPLCLYQYMTLGFGPSIEHEVLTQPYVVDLLISFCYSSAGAGKLADFPTGLGLSVLPGPSPPSLPIVLGIPYYAPYEAEPTTFRSDLSSGAQSVKFDQNACELLFDDSSRSSPLKVGEWILVQAEKSEEKYHCKVTETTLYPSVKLGPLVKVPSRILSVNASQRGPNRPPTPPAVPSTTLQDHTVQKWVNAKFDTYSVNFDGMGKRDRENTICKLLSTLPSVKEMRDYLISHKGADFRSWSDRISPSALGVLRWIIASNRACIVPIDDFDTLSPDGLAKSTEDRVFGMGDWVQFRFAMGAPDKEQQFVKAVRETTQRLDLKHPTLFAWHGSPLQNWHSIIREGLHFNSVAHGRAFGNGCYHSLHYATSLGYTNSHRSKGENASTWPSSLLRLTSAMSLNEIVNAPTEFVSATPHLVVAQLDWIQTRYLFVKCSGQQTVGRAPDVKPSYIHAQDPKMTPRGEIDNIIIPGKAGSRLSDTKRKRSQSGNAGANKKLKGIGDVSHPIVLEDGDSNDDDTESQATDSDDLEILFVAENNGKEVNEPIPTMTKSIESLTFKSLVSKSDFVAGSLDHSTLPQMPLPTYANTSATRRLQADFRALLKVQESQPLEELGWYINPEKFENVYQWIVELHTFEAFRDNGKDIPLVPDMKKQGVSSIVLELRFPGSYPMNPPFVRVIRPRFLGFQQGGGGHVTAGGALCMELLTNSGWSAVSSIESVLLQVRLAIASTDPKPARLQSKKDYGVGEAVEAFKRACRAHGWAIPPDFDSMAIG